ncbi:hypothetical protein SBA3_1040030 [Candidatus Sulfopaludibacter sp. SbA3]|nr:hypothetical protein SBA3_1040030 [Candidatus Sulfopaludibacter sp. SbA3]
MVSVSLQVLAAPQGNLIVSPNYANFDYNPGGPYPAPVYVSVASTGSPVSFNVSPTVSWISVSASSYVTPATVYVAIAPLPNMAAGTYTGAVRILPTNGGATQQVNVTLRVFVAGNLVASPNYLTFNYQPGGPSPLSQVLSVVNSNNGTVPFGVTASGGTWLGFSQASGNTPTTVLVSVTPAGLASGTYNGTITLTPLSGGASATQVPVTMTIFSTSQLVASPASLYFDYKAGGPTPASQHVSVTSTLEPLNFGVGVQGPGWVTASIASGTTPSGFAVNVLPPSTTAAGNYTATVTITPTSSGGSAVSVPVSVRVTAANYLTAGRSSVSFTYSIGGVNPPPVLVPVTSSSGSMWFEAAAVTTGSVNWLNVTQSNQYTPADVTIGVAPQGLSAGTYSGNVVLSSDAASNGDQYINVTLVVTASKSFTASPFGLVFSYQIGQDPPDPQVLVVNNQSSATPFSLTTATASGGNWLMAVGSGTTPTSAAVAVNASSLGTGTYTGQVVIQSSDTSIPVLQVPVVLNVSPSPVFQPAANLVAFQYQTGGATPASQKVHIGASGGAAVVYYPTILTADGSSWLSATPDVTATPSDLTVSINPKGLTAGLYYGLIGVNDPAGNTPTSFVPVSLQVSNVQILTVASQVLMFNTQTGTGGLAPQQFLVSGTGQTSPFHVTTYGGSWLLATPTDGFTNSTISVSAAPDKLGAGYYLGLVAVEIPGVANSQQFVPVVMVIAPGF